MTSTTRRKATPAKPVDLDDWFASMRPARRSVTLYRDAHLLGDIDGLRARLTVAQAIPAADLADGDETPEQVQELLVDVAQRFAASAMTFSVESRSDKARERVMNECAAAGVTDKHDITLHMLADAIVKPEGVTVELLQQLEDKAEAQIKMLAQASARASFEPPRM